MHVAIVSKFPFFLFKEKGNYSFFSCVCCSISMIPRSLITLYVYDPPIFLLQMAQTPLHISSGYNNAEIVEHLLNWPGAEKVELEAKNMVSRDSFYNIDSLVVFFILTNLVSFVAWH